MKKIVSIVLSFTLLFTLFGCSNSKYTKFSKSFLNLFDTASSITAYDTSQAEFNKKYNKTSTINNKRTTKTTKGQQEQHCFLTLSY